MLGEKSDIKNIKLKKQNLRNSSFTCVTCLDQVASAAFLNKEIWPLCAAVGHIFTRSVTLLSPLIGCKKRSALKDLRNGAIVLNLNGFRAVCTDGWVHSQIRRSIVQRLLFSCSNRTLSFSYCCLLRPLYHAASLHTLYVYTRKHTLFYSFSFSRCLSHPRPVLLLSLSNVPIYSSPPFLFPSTEERDKEIVFSFTNNQVGTITQTSKHASIFVSLFFFSFSKFPNTEKRDKDITFGCIFYVQWHKLANFTSIHYFLFCHPWQFVLFSQTHTSTYSPSNIFFFCFSLQHKFILWR